MIKHNFGILIAVLFAFAISACNLPNDNDLNCTMEYRYVSISVNGALFDDFYTIRQSNGEIVRYGRSEIPFENVYAVLADSYQEKLKNQIDTFIFHGYINDSLVVEEPFVINADHCHINYVSGTQEVDL